VLLESVVEIRFGRVVGYVTDLCVEPLANRPSISGRNASSLLLPGPRIRSHLVAQTGITRALRGIVKIACDCTGNRLLCIGFVKREGRARVYFKTEDFPIWGYFQVNSRKSEAQSAR
jgi:hypothetical protein